MRLRVRLPEAPYDPDLACTWALIEPTGRVAGEGEERVGALPSAAQVELIAPAGRVLLTRTALPQRAGQRMRQMLAYAIEDRITVDPARVHAALGPRLPDATHAVAVVDREWLAQWLAAYAAAGRRVGAVFVETCVPPLEPDAWTVIWRGADGFVRTGIASGMVLDIAGNSSPPVTLQLALREAAERTLAPAALLVRAENGPLPDLERWGAELGVPCIAGEPWDWTRAPSEGGFDLLQGELAPRGRARELLPRLRPALIIASLILALHVFGTLAHWAFLSHEKSRLQTQMRDMFRASFPDAQAIVDPALQMRRQFDALRRAAGELTPGDFVPLYAQAARSFAGHGERVRSVSYDRGKLSIDVTLDSRSQAEALVRKLNAAGAAAALDAVKPAGKGVEARFSFSAKGGT